MCGKAKEAAQHGIGKRGPVAIASRRAPHVGRAARGATTDTSSGAARIASMCLVRARVGSGLRSCGVRIPQCAISAPGHSRPTPSGCHLHRLQPWSPAYNDIYKSRPYTHHWSARHVYPRRTILSPGFKTVSKVTLGRPPAPCRLRWPRCRGGGSRFVEEVYVSQYRACPGCRARLGQTSRFGVMSRKLIAQIQDTVGSCGNDACTYPVRRARDPANRRPSNHAQLRSHALTDS